MSGAPPDAAARPGTAWATVPLAAGGLILVAIHLCYLISASLGHVEWCMPYVDGCTSISRASRRMPEVFVYRGFMIASGTVMLLYWGLSVRWVATLGRTSCAGVRVAAALGIVAALGLIMNATVIGAEDPTVRVFRRFCVITFFVGTWLAMMLLTHALHSVSRPPATRRLAGVVRFKIVVLGLMLALAIVNYGFMWVFEPLGWKDPLENAVEWQWVALLCLFYLASAWGWRASGLAPTWHTTPGNRPA